MLIAIWPMGMSCRACKHDLGVDARGQIALGPGAGRQATLWCPTHGCESKRRAGAHDLLEKGAPRNVVAADRYDHRAIVR
ncbi:hypothetical protein DENSPDRAFT_554135 [Dentipellis sp. KUC8613]|nr:hypothetical protein DENSPDRAFT_554135 [Dentipellis sp. KUC8613]